MQPATITELKRQVKRMQAAGMNVSLEKSNGLTAVYSKNGSRKLSMSGTRRQIGEWLDAFEQGFEAGEEHKFNEMRHGLVEAFDTSGE